MIRLFLSHNSEDKAFVRMLGSSLTDRGFQVWVDEGEIKYGESLIRKISEGIDGADYLLAILSENSVKSNWVKKELEIAITKEIQGDGIKVVPLVIDDCNIPTYMIDKRYADFRSLDQFDEKVEKLFKSLIPDSEIDVILDTVKRAIGAEFRAYKDLPEININILDEYFLKEGSAFKRIYHLLKKHRIRRWVISNEDNPSTYEMLSISLQSISGNEARVRTREYFYLRWYSSLFNKYKVIYNETNEQTYILKRKESENWKVDVNIYPKPK